MIHENRGYLGGKGSPSGEKIPGGLFFSCEFRQLQNQREPKGSLACSVLKANIVMIIMRNDRMEFT
jgi:hypothetical protein